MINKRKTKISHKSTIKSKKIIQFTTKFPIKSRYTQSYLDARNKYRQKVIEEANAQLLIDLSMSKDKMILEEDFDSPKKTLRIDDQPTYILLHHERYSSRNEKPPVYKRHIEDICLKSILKKI